MTHRSTVRLAAGVLAGLWIGTMAPSVLSGQSAKTVNDAVYTAAQAERGRKFFESSCTTCHEVGRFSGPDFIKVWEGESLYAIYDLMRTTMPEDNPGGLQPQQYADITAYFLQLNDFPAGDEELPGNDEAMRGVKIEPLKKSSNSRSVR